MPKADEFQELRDGLFFWQAYDPAVKVDLSCGAWRVPGGLVLLDPILLAKDALDELTAGERPVGIILSSGNHLRAAAEYRARFSIPIYAHAAAVAELGIPVDRLVGDGETVFGTLTIIALPGGAAGEVAIHRVEAEAGGALHVGDALIHLPSHGFTVLPEKYCADATLLRGSLGKLLRFPFEILTFAHGLPIVKNASARLAELLS